MVICRELLDGAKPARLYVVHHVRVHKYFILQIVVRSAHPRREKKYVRVLFLHTGKRIASKRMNEEGTLALRVESGAGTAETRVVTGAAGIGIAAVDRDDELGRGEALQRRLFADSVEQRFEASGVGVFLRIKAGDLDPSVGSTVS